TSGRAAKTPAHPIWCPWAKLISATLTFFMPFPPPSMPMCRKPASDTGLCRLHTDWVPPSPGTQRDAMGTQSALSQSGRRTSCRIWSPCCRLEPQEDGECPCNNPTQKSRLRALIEILMSGGRALALKIGLVGVGGIGKLHLKCYKEDPLAEVVAVADAVIEKAEEAAKEYGIKAYRSVQEMLDAHPDIDIVDVLTGGHENGSWHYEPVMAALERKKHVIVEKPLSNDLQEAREMVAKADEVGVYFACNLNHYFTPPAEEAKRLIESGELGELRYCLMKMGFSGGEPLYGGPPKDPRFKDYPYFHAKAFLAHPFSVMRYFCGDVMEIQAFFGRPAFRQAAGENLF